MTIDQEKPEHELGIAAAAAALVERWKKEPEAVPRRHLQLKDVQVTRAKRRIVVKLTFRGGQDITVSINRAWASVIMNRLRVGLGK